jgi:hypothetical protein
VIFQHTQPTPGRSAFRWVVGFVLQPPTGRVYTPRVRLSTTHESITFACTATPDPSGWAESQGGSGTVLTLTRADFSGEIIYTVTVTAADDLEGNPLSGHRMLGTWRRCRTKYIYRRC